MANAGFSYEDYKKWCEALKYQWEGGDIDKLVERFKQDKLFKNVLKEVIITKPMVTKERLDKIKLWLDIYNKKEVKKVNRPYLECKVVKVKKKKRKCEHPLIIHKGRYYCKKCGKEMLVDIGGEGRIVQEKPKGNWINGENLDKIKFPVPCSYVYLGNKGYGMLNKCFMGDGLYELHRIKQSKDVGVCNRVTYSGSLKHLIKTMDIHILKGKIILYEEED